MAKIDIVEDAPAEGPMAANVADQKETPKVPKLVLNMIVKNEESNLSHNFARVEGLVDAIILLDTGSTDDTVNKA